MNPTTTTTDPTQPPPPPLPPPQPPRSSFSCDKHPHEDFTGFCPECLFERLTTLDNPSTNNNNNNNNPSSSSRIKSLFSKTNLPPKPSSKPSSFFPELRRTKSFSASRNEGLSLFEPQRKSCDVRVRNTLWSLFSETKNPHPEDNSGGGVLANNPVIESKEEEEDEQVNVVVNEITEEITEEFQSPLENSFGGQVISSEIVEEEVVNGDILMPMKDHIDLDSQAKKPSRDLKEIAGSFLSAASVFSKKWHHWRRKQKAKKRNNCENSSTLSLEKPTISRKFRETQSEIADYGFGRRSCDTEPRFSLDIGRISIDDPRYSFDEPRASCDVHFMGRNIPRVPPMVSVIEDAPVVAQVQRADDQIPVEESPVSANCIGEETDLPGGSAQTRDYYLDSSSRRRKSLDRSNSIRKTAAAVVAEIDEMKAVSNAKVQPERDLNSISVSNPNSLRDDYSETFELTGFKDSSGSGIGNGERKGSKKSKKWAWNIWGFIHKKGNGNKDEEDDRYSRSNGVERSFSGSWRNGDLRGGLNRNMFRSNSSVSWRNSTNIGGSFGTVRNLGIDTNGNSKKKDDFVLERNRSARYSPNHVDNGFLRFHFAPMRGSRRGLPAQNRSNGRSVLRLY
ncbi:protein OCTOPUS-like [Lycium ferocissimum]|uniref:protein OCTOPUS-like n=1 Tax=Lycium ferocissimum TaxID=112874 RepID=UPI0028163CDC|nr:protein OCTOPUS-like [Lycium ferocissimum]